MQTIYLDNAATTKVDPRVLEAMLPFFSEDYGNASSIHSLGRKPNVAVEEARGKIAHYLNTKPANIIFTSGGTESNNAAIKGVLKASGKKEVITSPLEHHAVLHPLECAAADGVKNILLNTDSSGKIDLEQLRHSITESTALVSLMHVNNEIGTINPVSEIAAICWEKGVSFHSDTVQSVGKISVDIEKTGFDFLSISAHKIHGPKGVGALYVNPDAPWQPWMEGGSQERKRRGGTLNVPGIIGLGKAVEIACEEMAQNRAHIEKLKSGFVLGLKEKFGETIVFNGDLENGTYNIVNISFLFDDSETLDGEMLLLNLDIEGINCSNGSACSSGAVEASHVLTALGIPEKTAKSSIRFSLSKYNTEEDIRYTLEKLEQVLRRMTN